MKLKQIQIPHTKLTKVISFKFIKTHSIIVNHLKIINKIKKLRNQKLNKVLNFQPKKYIKTNKNSI